MNKHLKQKVKTVKVSSENKKAPSKDEEQIMPKEIKFPLVEVKEDLEGKRENKRLMKKLEKDNLHMLKVQKDQNKENL